MQFIYTTKHVSTPEEYIDALLQGYRVIELPKSQRPALLQLLRERWQENDALTVEYARQLVSTGGEEEKHRAFEVLQPLLKGGFAPALTILAWLYAKGWDGGEKSLEKAAEWYERAAEGGDAVAQCNIGVYYEKGSGVPQSFEKAAEWYERSAQQGDAKAQCNLGACYRYGRGVPQSYEKAAEWYRRSAEQGFAAAQGNLAACYLFARGVPRSYEQAIFWYEKGAEQGDVRSQCSLGDCYKRGTGVEKSPEKAIYWYQKAAEQGEAYAQYGIGFYYEQGKHLPKSYEKAIEWYEKAAEQGYVPAISRLKAIRENQCPRCGTYFSIFSPEDSMDGDRVCRTCGKRM